MASILYVDDDPKLGESALAAALDGHALHVVNTNEEGWREQVVTLLDSQIVISDLKLEARDHSSGFDPADGRTMNGLIAGLQRERHTSALFMIYSAALDEAFSGRDRPSSLFAKAEAVEATWVGRKPGGEGMGEFPAQVRMFADAVDSVCDMPREDEKALLPWLYDKLELARDTEWRPTAEAQLISASPELVDAFGNGDRLAAVRWLASSGLRYPSFLLDRYEVALRLRVDVNWFDSMAAEPLVSALDGYAGYRGLLSSLDGKRWWRAAVDDWIWTQTDGRPNSASALEEALTRVVAGSPAMLSIDDPVLTYDRYGATEGDVVSVEDAVRIAPPGWPAAAGTAWASKSRAKTKPLLRAIVIPEDLDAVELA